jgi:hypothetical protein
MKFNRKWFSVLIAAATVGLALTACGGGGDGSSSAGAPTTATYRVSLTNITNNQPMSPPAVILHTDGYTAWRLGEAVSEAIERLAEAGDPSDLISEALANPNVLGATSGSGVILPGAEDNFEISVASSALTRVSIATMLVNTNDAFSGIDDRSLGNLTVGSSITFTVPAYDAGTEANSEDAASVPGPAGGGEGFNTLRNDVNWVRVHPGVISFEDGLTGSTLDGSHRFDNPVIKLTITRIV